MLTMSASAASALPPPTPATAPTVESGSRPTQADKAPGDSRHALGQAEAGSSAAASRNSTSDTSPAELTAQEVRQVEQLKTTDREVRQHERAHQTAGGVYSGSASYEYQRGPDDKPYAVAGEVPIDYGEVAGDPRATIEKMQQVISAALAPADPSPQDHQVAAQARQRLLTAQLELAQQQSAERQSAPQAGGRGDSDSPATQRDPRVERYTAIEAGRGGSTPGAALNAVA